MYYVLRTQHLENYGVFDDEPRPKWKAKGGDIYVLYYNNVRHISNILLNNFTAEECVRHSGGFCTYPAGKIVDVRSERGDNVYNWVAEEVDCPFFKFVYVIDVDKWEITDVDLYEQTSYDDNDGALRLIADKIKELTRGKTI